MFWRPSDVLYQFCELRDKTNAKKECMKGVGRKNLNTIIIIITDSVKAMGRAVRLTLVANKTLITANTNETMKRLPMPK